jgi:hypothetical protein
VITRERARDIVASGLASPGMKEQHSGRLEQDDFPQPGATWSKARLDTKGSSWRVAFVFVLTALPVLVINGLLAWLWLSLLTPQAQPSAWSFLFFSVIGAVIAIAALCAFAAAASHIYRARADIMTRPR